MSRITWNGLVLSLMAILLVTMPLVGQDRRDRGPRSQDRQEMERRFRAQMARMIQDELGLSEEEYRELTEVTGRFRQERRSLMQSEMATRRRVEALMLEGADDPQEARSLLERLVELRQEEAAIFREEQAALLELLTPEQVLRLHSIRERISRRIRALRGRRGGERPDGHVGVRGAGLLAPDLPIG